MSADTPRSDTALPPAALPPAGRRVVGPPEWHARIQLYLTIGDALAILATLAVVQALWPGADSSVRVGWIAVDHAVVGSVIGLVWLFFLAVTRSRQTRVLAAGDLEYRRVLNATLLAFGTAAILAFLLQVSFSRGYFLLALPLGVLLVLAGRWFWRRYLSRARRRDRYVDHALVIGTRADAQRLTSELARHRSAGLSPVAVCVLDDDPGEITDAGDNPLPRVPRLDLVAGASSSSVDVVVVAGEMPRGREDVRRLGWDLEGTHAELILESRLTDIAGPRLHLRPVEGLPLVYVTLPQFSGATYAVKRATDVILSAAALVVLSPLLLTIALLVRLGDGGPAFFRQVRVGANGRPFTMLKFRSMRVDAEDVRARLLEQDEGAGLLFKMKDDPRITRVGRVLRKLSLDELPQFLNVLGGSMSVVGPRPPLPDEVAAYEGDVGRRLLIKPGITGLWQVSGRSDLSWEESVRLDLMYVENWSITGDLALIARTVVTVLRRDGAY
ncbi:polyprenyl glycosylphosphotransferase [Serinibacter arcticus]|uniref:Polyprenyl glycosylphosphotransferase n=1 Tax=Serinibacter arcticus TaxID=1655435 RepID=A0A2U1ZYB6_9MICO|nr:sugar transferase [Serinibacter arcticus]PWD51923.1 polyprenyl glycosylphosphotransferase [Serinibacter arcticus]